MALNFSNIKEWVIPEGEVTKLTINNVIMWQKSTVENLFDITKYEELPYYINMDNNTLGTTRSRCIMIPIQGGYTYKYYNSIPVSTLRIATCVEYPDVGTNLLQAKQSAFGSATEISIDAEENANYLVVQIKTNSDTIGILSLLPTVLVTKSELEPIVNPETGVFEFGENTELDTTSGVIEFEETPTVTENGIMEFNEDTIL